MYYITNEHEWNETNVMIVEINEKGNEKSCDVRKWREKKLQVRKEKKVGKRES